MYVYCTLTEVLLNLTEVFLTLTEVFLTLTEVFPCFFLSCKANARVKRAKTGHGPHPSTLVVICVVRLLLCCSMYCLCVNVYCHRVTTQLQLIYHKMRSLRPRIRPWKNAAVSFRLKVGSSSGSDPHFHITSYLMAESQLTGGRVRQHRIYSSTGCVFSVI